MLTLQKRKLVAVKNREFVIKKITIFSSYTLRSTLCTLYTSLYTNIGSVETNEETYSNQRGPESTWKYIKKKLKSRVVGTIITIGTTKLHWTRDRRHNHAIWQNFHGCDHNWRNCDLTNAARGPSNVLPWAQDHVSSITYKLVPKHSPLSALKWRRGFLAECDYELSFTRWRGYRFMTLKTESQNTLHWTSKINRSREFTSHGPFPDSS